MYVAVGNNGMIAISSDNGRNWRFVDSHVSVNLNSVVFDSLNNKFYAVGNEGVVIYSLDANNWTSRIPLTPVVNLFTALSVDGNLFIGAEQGLVFEIEYPRDVVRLSGGATSADVVTSAYDSKNRVMYIGNSDGSVQHKYAAIWSSSQWTTPFYLLNANNPIVSLSYDEEDGILLASDIVGNVFLGTRFVWSSAVNIKHGGLSQVFYDKRSDKFIGVVESGGLAYSDDYNSWSYRGLGDTGYKEIKCNNVSCVMIGRNGMLMSASSRDDIQMPLLLLPESVYYDRLIELHEPSNASKIYGRDTLIRIQIGTYGLKGFDVFNSTGQAFKIGSAFDPQVKDIVVDYGRSSCFQGDPNKHLSLEPGTSCTLVYRYNPTEVNSIKKFSAGLSVMLESQQEEVSSPIDVFYSSYIN